MFPRVIKDRAHGWSVVLADNERAVLADLASGADRASATRARVILARARLASDRAVAVELGLDPRTVATWRRRFAQQGMAALTGEGETTRSHEGGPSEQALLTPLEESPPGGERWTTRTVAEQAGLSQSMVSRVWRAAGFRPPPAEVLVADPWCAGMIRCVAGVYTAPASDASRPGYRAVAFYVDDAPSTTRRRSREVALPVAAADRRDVFDAATAVCTALDQPGETPTVGEAAVGWRVFVSQLAQRCPDQCRVWLMTSVRPTGVEAAWLRQQPVTLRTMSSIRAWTAIAVRSLAATTLTGTVRDLPSRLGQVASQLQTQPPTQDGERNWILTAEAARASLTALRRRRARQQQPRTSRPAPLELSHALHRLRTRRQGHIDTEQPAYELLTQLRVRAVDEQVDATDCADALAVLTDLATTRDRLEAALIGYCREVWTPPRDIAHQLGLRTLHAVGQRARRLTTPHRARASHAPTPRDAHEPPGRRTRELLDELHQRWTADLVDDEARIETLPGTGDVYGSLAYILARDRPVLAATDPGMPSPLQRRQADGLAGLTLAGELHHQLHWERYCWYQLAEQTGLPIARRAAALGRSPSAVLRDRYRLQRRYSQPDTAETPPTHHHHWNQHAEAIRDAIAALQQHRSELASDEDAVFWLEELEYTMNHHGRPAVGLFLGFISELAEPHECEHCDAPRPPVLPTDHGTRRCARCTGRHQLAEIVEHASAVGEPH